MKIMIAVVSKQGLDEKSTDESIVDKKIVMKINMTQLLQPEN